MATIDTILFEQFAEALNGELAVIGATLRVTRGEPGGCHTMILQDAGGCLLGAVPDHVDAPTIKAFEAIMTSRDALQRRT